MCMLHARRPTLLHWCAAHAAGHLEAPECTATSPTLFLQCLLTTNQAAWPMLTCCREAILKLMDEVDRSPSLLPRMFSS